MRKFSTLLLFLGGLFPSVVGAQSIVQKQLVWQPIQQSDANGQLSISHWAFEGAIYSDEHPNLPYFLKTIPLATLSTLHVELVDAQYEMLTDELPADKDALQETIIFKTTVEKARGAYLGKVYFVPMRRIGERIERMTSFSLRIQVQEGRQPQRNQPEIVFRGDNTYTSALSNGDIYKIAVSESGIYKLDYDFLSKTLGINLNGLDPRTIKLYGNGGGMLSEVAGQERIDDLAENAIQIVGEDDGKFDPQDYILFYGQQADEWYFDVGSRTFSSRKNIYDDKTYYFLKISSGNGLRITTQESLPSGAYTTTTFDDYWHKEDEKVNLLDQFESGEGSGKRWYGDQFKNATEYSYSHVFPNIVIGDTVKIASRLASRARQATTFSISTNSNQSFTSTRMSLGSASFTRPTEEQYAAIGTLTGAFPAQSDNISLTVRYTGGDGWLDFITLTARRKLQLTGGQLIFRDTRSLDFATATFQLSNATATTAIWEVTNPLQPKLQNVRRSGSGLDFSVTSSVLKEFVAFESSQALKPEAVGKVENQNLHGLDGLDMVILFHKDFTEQAARLAEHRRTFSGLRVDTVRIDLLYNEFSSGKQDVVAIRDFAKMLYDRNPNFTYLLLFGDGSFDYKNIKGGQNSNFIPAYETDNSEHPITAYTSDDFFALLDDGEGVNLSGALDISVGRIPVKTNLEARQVVDKIIHYETSAKTLGDWRNRLTFVADDEDGNLHLGQTDKIADKSHTLYPAFNQEKVYFDAFPQVSTSGGEGFPLATEALDKGIFKGTLAVNYLGHGGSKGWAQERVLDKDRGDIRNWSNYDKLPVFITATCSFAGFDDRNQVTAGEEVLLNPRGGGIALFTTVRAVYAHQNEALVRSVFDTMFYKINGERPALGDILRIAKNRSGAGNNSNSRKFLLLGDPAVQLALPQYDVVTTRINGRDIAAAGQDTLRALQKVTIEGEVRGTNGQLLTDFNGELFPTLFDKAVTYTTLGQDPGSNPQNFTLQKNTIFKGRASVQNGRFSFTFVVPKDINYSFGTGKISYYAADGNTMADAAGVFENIIIGGTDANTLADDKGPEVDVYMNSEEFVFGSITNENPTLLVKLADDNGINIAGNSIGHDLEGILNEDTQKTILLNDFYQAELDDYTKGTVRYPLSGLEPGRYQVRVRAWDVANNSSEGYTEFVVAPSADVALRHVLNYPNPFVNSTCFQFEHNLGEQELDVLIHIYTISGRLVKSLEQRVLSDGFIVARNNCIEWDGTDDFGDQLARGVYLYRVKIRAVNTGETELSGESDFEKLVILK